jgi:hypothetical protein
VFLPEHCNPDALRYAALTPCVRHQFHNSPPHRRLKTLFHDSVQQASGSLGDKIADLRIVLFVRCLRCEIGDEVLEARIIPERIEHWVEPEQGWSKRSVGRRECANPPAPLIS